MTLDRAKELLEIQVKMASGYNRNAAKLILVEVQNEHGPAAVDHLIRDMNLEQVFGFQPGQIFKW